MRSRVAVPLLIAICMQFCSIAVGRDPPVVQIPDQGEIMGYFMTMFRTQKIVTYLGIPYAQPPINERRFAPPVVESLPSWEGIRNASQMPMECWSDTRKPVKQHDEIFLRMLGINAKSKDVSRFSEDCLFLNIYVPDDPPPKDGYAVIVWLHSGDFASGNASELNPFQLVFKQKVIVVTVAFRLGIFGFFTSIDGEASGNFGLMDQSAALFWVNRNIKLFNGNPLSVTLMGHGSGAVSASLHLTSGDWSGGNFQRVILMSGPLLSTSVVRDPKSYKSSLDQVADAFGCFRRPTAEMLACLRRVDAAILMDNNPILDWLPVIDEGLSNTTTPFISDDPKILLTSNQLSKVPVMIGFTDMEDVLDVSTGEVLHDGLSMEMYDTLIREFILNELEQLEANNETVCLDGGGFNSQPILEAFEFVYQPFPPVTDPSILRRRFIEFSTERSFVSPAFALATALSKNSEVFMYRFDIKPKTAAVVEMLPAWAGVPHRFDMIFSWGMPYWVMLENQTQWSSEDKRASDIIMTLWANFAKYSNPTEMGVYIQWANFTPTQQGVLIIDRSFNMSDPMTFNYRGVRFWNDYYPKVIDFATQCCNVTSAATSMHRTIIQTVILSKSAQNYLLHLLLICLLAVTHAMNS